MFDAKRLALVDDSPDEAEFVRRALAKACPDADLVVFSTGAEALEYLSRAAADETVGLPDVVLLDLKIPGLDGHAILDVLRRGHSCGRLPVVVFTSSREPSDLRRAYGAGANSYVVKPLVFEEYLRLVGLTAQYWLEANVRLDQGDDLIE